MGIKHLAILACALIVGQTAAARERFNLDLNDKAYSGKSSLALKQLLQRQHRVNAANYELIGIRLIAKSKNGGGTAALNVGRWTSNDKRITGSPADWNRTGPRTFDTLDFNNNAPRDRGVWQVDMQGNIKVRRVVLIVQRIGGGGGGGNDELVRYKNVRCESRGIRQQLCPVAGKIETIRVLERYSSMPCVAGRTFGVYDRGLWVRGGCRATFQLGIKVRN